MIMIITIYVYTYYKGILFFNTSCFSYSLDSPVTSPTSPGSPERPTKPPRPGTLLEDGNDDSPKSRQAVFIPPPPPASPPPDGTPPPFPEYYKGETPLMQSVAVGRSVSESPTTEVAPPILHDGGSPPGGKMLALCALVQIILTRGRMWEGGGGVGGPSHIYRNEPTLLTLVANLANTKLCKEYTKKTTDTWVLIWEYSAIAFQWIPIWQGLDGFQKSLHSCVFGWKYPQHWKG